MKLLSFNVNGIRAIVGKSFISDMQEIDFDVICLQETKATVAQVNIALEPLQGYQIYAKEAEKKGYSGVSTWSRIGISEEGRGISTNVDINDSEGRVLHTKHGNLHCINIYLPNGGANIDRQKFKDQWLEDLLIWSKKFIQLDEVFIISGEPDAILGAIFLVMPARGSL